jgi:hypothetical protein
MKIFGFEIRKQQTELGALVPPKTEDGTHDQVSYGSGAAMYGYSFDIEGRYRSESERIQKYRSMAMSPEIDMAIEEITSEAIVIEDDKPPMSLSVFAEKNEIPDAVSKSITDEFDNVVSLLRLNTDGHDLFRRWYVDGRYYAHIVVDESNVAEGIKDIRQLDSRKTKKIREIIKSKTPDGVEVVSGTEEYFIYNDKGLASTESTALRLSPDVLLYAPSGLMDEAGTVISHIHKSIKPYNQLRYMEDACLIYTLSRAPQRRVFYIDVADMPKQKAEQYIQDVMNRYKNKVVYNNSTGEISDDRVHTSMLEDYWLPRRSNGRTTEITTLPGDSVMSNMDNIMYFMNKLYASLNLPQSRVKADQSGFNLGRASEITRDEVKFSKFVNRLRIKFAEIPLQALRVQLILKGIIAPEDWTFVRSKLKVQYQKDNFFAELKESEIMQGRIGLAEAMQPFVGSIFSQNYIKRNVFRLSDEEVDSMDEEIAEEQQQGVYDDPNAGSTDSEQPQASQKSPNRRSAPKGE